MANPEHLAVLAQGVKAWKRWRKREPTRPDLSGASLFGITYRGEEPLWKGYVTDLAGVNLSETDLDRAFIESTDLSGADLSGAVLSRSNLRRADLSNANLRGADLYEADLYQANLQGATLADAQLTRARLVDVNLEDATLENCNVYGVAAWDVKLNQRTNQTNLVISDPSRTWEPPIVLDNVEVAQFVHLLLRNEKIRGIIDTVTSKTVLILGRFTTKRKRILDALRVALRDYGFVPILFDFPPSPSRDLTETIQLLAAMARFVIADLTDAKSLPQELTVIVPNLPSVPIQPILLESQYAYAMFEHWERYPWVLAKFLYKNERQLLRDLKDKVIAPASSWRSKAADDEVGS